MAITGGVGEALIATVTGLAVATFALLGHSYFGYRLDGMVTDMERWGTWLEDKLSAGQAERMAKRGQESIPVNLPAASNAKQDVVKSFQVTLDELPERHVPQAGSLNPFAKNSVWKPSVEPPASGTPANQPSGGSDDGVVASSPDTPVANGDFAGAYVSGSAGSSLLDNAALQAVQQSFPFPHGAGKSITLTVPIHFDLQG